MKQPFVPIAVLVSLCSIAEGAQSPAKDAPREPVLVRVDPRVELLTVVARLAQFPEFAMSNSRSPYAERVEARFGAQREHAAIATLRTLRAEHGVSYDAIPSLAVHLDAVPSLALRIPRDAAPERLDGRWESALTERFLAELREFAATTGASAFFEAERTFFARVEQRLGDRLAQSEALGWFDSFFGVKAGALYVAIPGLLCGGGNYGVGVRFADGTPEEITPIFGCWDFDAEGVPRFGPNYLPLYVHELCHSYTNPFVDRFAKELQASGTRIHASCAERMQRFGYGTWRTVLYETLVRAAVIRCRGQIEGPEAAGEQTRSEVAQGFAWVPGLAELYRAYEDDRAKTPTFEAFMPRVVAYFDAYAATLAAIDAQRPLVVSTSPASGTVDVDPALATLTITFDRRMRDQSFSIVGDAPRITGKLAYDAGRTVLSVPIALEPGRAYRFALNSAQHQGFQSETGVPLAPLDVTFTTRAR